MTSVPCPGANEWDLFILGSDSIERAALERHLESCHLCRFLVEKRREELQHYSRRWSQPDSPRLFYLYQWRGALLTEVGMPAIAAEGLKLEVGSESTTLLSTDQRIMLKAVRDSHTREVWLYLISDDPSLYQNVLVRPFGGSECMTDEKGRVNLGRIPWPDSEKLTAEVRVARARFCLVPFKDIPQPEGTIILSSPDGDQVRISLQDTGAGKALRLEIMPKETGVPAAPLKIAVREKGSRELVMIKSDLTDQLELPRIDSRDTIEIYLFT